MVARAPSTDTLTTTWVPLAEPVHVRAAGSTEPSWKDAAYLSFWNVGGDVYRTYDDVMTLRNETGDDAGFFEQGIVHRVR